MDSKLQIISGRFHGRKLFLPRDARPTQNRARAALFNMLAAGFFDTDAVFTVWDAFAGSGAFGIECLSRYPNSKAIFTDVAPESIKTVRKNLALLNVGTVAITEQVDAITAVKKYGVVADLIFVDAPYDLADTGYAFVRALTKRVRTGAIVIWEQEASNAKDAPHGWLVLRDKTYGRARFMFLQRVGE